MLFECDPVWPSRLFDRFRRALSGPLRSPNATCVRPPRLVSLTSSFRPDLPGRQTLRACDQRVCWPCTPTQLVNLDPSRAAKRYVRTGLRVFAPILRNVTHVMVLMHLVHVRGPHVLEMLLWHLSRSRFRLRHIVPSRDNSQNASKRNA